eukprot:gene26589-46495_t
MVLRAVDRHPVRTPADVQRAVDGSSASVRLHIRRWAPTRRHTRPARVCVTLTRRDFETCVPW